MADETQTALTAAGQQVERRIYTVRGLNVMLDSDLAELYGVETAALNRAVKRNSSRFPDDFMFQLTGEEAKSLTSQIVISNKTPIEPENLKSQIGISNENVPEAESLICQIGTSNAGRGGRRKPTTAFTEQGVAMLSGVLRSERAVQVNIAIMRAFISLRGMLTTENDLARRILTLETKYDKQFATVFEAIRRLMETEKPAPPPERRMGFRAHKDDKEKQS